MYAPENGVGEKPNRDRLLIDVIYRAVRRMKEGDRADAPTAPDVFLVNLSLGDSTRRFAGAMSPWARLLDFLAARYGILFLVSAGNVQEPPPVNEFPNWTAFEDADPQKRESAVLHAISERKASRTLLSPAEALNVITVGAKHDDAVKEPRGAGAVAPYTTRELPNVSSALGLGHRKIIKPDIHMPEGREHVRFQASGPTLLIAPEGEGRSGLIAASPDAHGKLDRTRLSMGTSAATALATRSAHLILDTLMDRNGSSMHADMDPQFWAVVVKALLVHRASWGNRGELLDRSCNPRDKGKHTERRENIARLLGYGFPAIEEALSCTPNRATLVGYGAIAARETNVHRIPLTRSLEGVKELRRLTMTVAWFSPVNPHHQAYRQARLEVTGKVADPESAVGVSRLQAQPSKTSMQRGTVFHAHHEGDRAVPFVDDGHVSVRLHCKEQAGPLEKKIPYGIAVTIEAGEGIPVYDEIRARLAVPVDGRTSS